LAQFRIKRLFAYSTISHIGFILLALSTNTIESIQSFVFYLMQYSITNVNAFVLLVAVGSSLYLYVDNKKESLSGDHSNIGDKAASSLVSYQDVNNETVGTAINYNNLETKSSPIQLISQLKGYFYINPYVALSLAITLFSFVGIPPLVGFFAKQMVLSSALDKGYVFMALVGILTSAVSAYYYLAIVKDMYFNKSDYVLNPALNKTTLKAHISNNTVREDVVVNINNIQLSGSISISISVLTLTILLFMLTPQE
jgi:NADH-ubiquinone oxidoreductase chain 2